MRRAGAKVEELKQASSAAILAGVALDVLGDSHTYPTGVTDQANLNGLVTESLLPDAGDDYKFWCVDPGGIWMRRSHTKIQIQALGKAVANHVKTQQQHYENKLSELRLAGTEQAVNSGCVEGPKNRCGDVRFAKIYAKYCAALH